MRQKILTKIVGMMVERFGSSSLPIDNLKERIRTSTRQIMRPTDWMFLVVLGLAALFVTLQVVYLLFVLVHPIYSVLATVINDFPANPTIANTIQFTKTTLSTILTMLGNAFNIGVLQFFLWVAGAACLVGSFVIWVYGKVKNIHPFKKVSNKGHLFAWLLLILGLGLQITSFI